MLRLMVWCLHASAYHMLASCSQTLTPHHHAQLTANSPHPQSILVLQGIQELLNLSASQPSECLPV